MSFEDFRTIFPSKILVEFVILEDGTWEVPLHAAMSASADAIGVRQKGQGGLVSFIVTDKGVA